MREQEKEIDKAYSEARAYVDEKLGKTLIAVLSTCADKKVSARSMSIVFINEKIYFQTDSRFKKAKQMEENPYAVICFENISIEGTITDHGAGKNEVNKHFLEVFAEKHPGSFRQYSFGLNQKVYSLSPKLILIWKYEDACPVQIFLYPDTKELVKAPYLPNSEGDLYRGEYRGEN